jgi:hypothetical protein
VLLVSWMEAYAPAAAQQAGNVASITASKACTRFKTAHVECQCRRYYHQAAISWMTAAQQAAVAPAPLPVRPAHTRNQSNVLLVSCWSVAGNTGGRYEHTTCCSAGWQHRLHHCRLGLHTQIIA